VRRSGEAHVYSKERWEPDDEQAEDSDLPLWRRDGSWVNLLTESWRIERPFVGNVYLWSFTGGPSEQGLGSWRICYTPNTDGFRDEERCYVYQNGAIARHPLPTAAAGSVLDAPK